MRKTCIFSFSGYNLISCRNEPTVTAQVAEPRPELRRAALRRRAAPWREASQAARTSASSSCIEDEGQGVGPSGQLPRVGLPHATLPNTQPPLTTGPSGDSRKLPQWKPQHASRPSALPGTGGLPQAAGMPHQCLCW